MKRTLLGGLLLLLVFSGVMAALLRQPREEYREDQIRLLACIINPNNRYYWEEVQAGIEKADEEFGCDTRIAIFSRYDEAEHLRVLEETGFYHLDGIITIGAPSEPAIDKVIGQRVKEGIPVALLDTDSPESGRTFYIGTDNRKAGRDAAEWVLGQAKEKVQALVIITGLSDANQKERLEGFREALEEAGGSVAEVYAYRQDKQSFVAYLDEFFEGNTSVNAVFCAEASSTGALGLYLEGRGKREDFWSVGFDDVPPTGRLIEEGILGASMVQRAQEMGYLAVKSIVGYLTGEDTQAGAIYTGTVLESMDGA